MSCHNFSITRRGKPFKDETELWMIENDLKAWCLDPHLLSVEDNENQ